MWRRSMPVHQRSLIGPTLSLSLVIVGILGYLSRYLWLMLLFFLTIIATIGLFRTEKRMRTS